MTNTTFAQYYYNNILTHQQNTLALKQYKLHKVALVAVESYDGQNRPDRNFSIRSTINATYSGIETKSQSDSFNVAFQKSVYNGEGLLTSQTDSSTGWKTENKFMYDGEKLTGG